jgi:outer membrane protein TolC
MPVKPEKLERRRPARPSRRGAAPAARARGPIILAAALALATVAAAGRNGSPAEDPGLAGPLTAERFHVPDRQLGALMATVLENNPKVAALRARSRASFQRVPQARSLPDPLFTYKYFAETPETRVGPQDHLLEFSQSVPWGGKRERQSLRAQSLAVGTAWEVEDLERALVAQLKRGYFEVAYLQEALMVNSEERELLRRFEGIALKRYATGQGIQQSVVKVQTDLSQLDDREEELRQRLHAVLRRISQLTGRPESRLALGPIELLLPDLAFDTRELEQIAVSGHPRVRAMEQRAEADSHWVKRRKLESRPDFRLGVGYIVVGEREDRAGTLNPPQDNGKDALALTVGINIPLYRKRIHAGVAEASESEQTHLELLNAVRDQLRFDIQEAVLRLDSLGERARLFGAVIIPQAEESLGSAEAAYTTDRLGFLDLLDAERVLFESRLSYHRLVSDFWIALADLEFSVGESFPGPQTGDADSDKAKAGSPS